MAHIHKSLLTISLACTFFSFAIATSRFLRNSTDSNDLIACTRLNLADQNHNSSVNCWDSLFKLLRNSTESNDLMLRTGLNSDDQNNNSSTNCWESLFKLQACSGEVIQFFYNGEAYLGSECCNAILVIVHDCWPSMLNSLGFTTEEGDILKGYCDAKDHDHQPSTDPAKPSPPQNAGPNNHD